MFKIEKKSRAIIAMIIDYTKKGIIKWKYGEKHLRSEVIVKYYNSEFEGSKIEFDDNQGDILFDNIHIELDKNQYKDLNKEIIKQINESKESVLDDIFGKLKRKQ